MNEHRKKNRRVIGKERREKRNWSAGTEERKLGEGENEGEGRKGG